MKKEDKRLLHRALDGEATTSETKRLQERLRADGKMRSEFEQLQKVVHETTRIRVDVPKDFTAKVLEETKRLKRSDLKKK